MFHDALKKLKEKLQNQKPTPEKESALPVEEPVNESSLPAEKEEALDILEYVEKHGVENKDLPGKAESASSQKPHNPVMKKKPKQKPAEPVDLSDFEEPELDPEAGAEEILSYIDTHGIELKSADTGNDRSSGESNLVRSRKSTEKQVDLHGLRAREAELKIRRVFKDAKKRGYQQILIIHGRGNHSAGGDPILKRMVMDLLEGPLESQVASFYFAPLNEGGGGATRVVLR